GRISGQVFRDTKGSLTIGYGHYIKEEEKWNWAAYDPEQGGTRELSIAEMEALFRQDVQRLAEADVKKRFSVPLLQQEYDALVDFTFHRGAGALRDSDLEGYINSVPDGNFDYGVIQDNFMKYAFWFNRNTNQWEYVEGFAKRRREEIDMFRYGRYTLHS
ncbi:MAG: lysozyme, partial [Saprospiraceae bacterium]|nr:lysozyme [Saprospiraceae bacterium]MCB0626791.1 lysozyme [Saprospiraceae bacterium]